MPKTPTPPNTLERTFVWDRLVRIFHWSLVALFIVVFFSGRDGNEELHSIVGYLLLAIIGVRVVWGFIGTAYARFSSFIYSPTTIIVHLAEITRGKKSHHYLGHNPAGGAMVILLLILMVIVGFTGIALLATIEFEGPLVNLLYDWNDQQVEILRDLHDLFLNILLISIAIHIFSVYLISFYFNEGLIRAMFTGYKFKK